MKISKIIIIEKTRRFILSYLSCLSPGAMNSERSWWPMLESMFLHVLPEKIFSESSWNIVFSSAAGDSLSAHSIAGGSPNKQSILRNTLQRNQPHSLMTRLPSFDVKGIRPHLWQQNSEKIRQYLTLLFSLLAYFPRKKNLINIWEHIFQEKKIWQNLRVFPIWSIPN